MYDITAAAPSTDDLWVRLLVRGGIEAAQAELHDASATLQSLVEECAWSSSGMRALTETVGTLTHRVAVERSHVAQLLWTLR